MYLEVQRIIQNNPSVRDKPSSFYEFMNNGYVTLAATAVRRQVKVDKQSISLAGLMTELSETPEVFSRERFKQEHPNYIGADGFFDEFAGNNVTNVNFYFRDIEISRDNNTDISIPYNPGFIANIETGALISPIS